MITTAQPQSQPAPTLVIEVTAKITAAQRVDLIALFDGFGDREKKQYAALNLSEWGMDAEWERPLAFIWPDEDVMPLTLVPGARTGVGGDVPDVEARLEARNGQGVWGREAEWSVDDFATLRTHVGWLDEWHTKREMGSLSREDAARLPGPDDVPLF